MLCGAIGIPYNAGSLPKQSGTVIRRIVKLALPPKDRGVESKRADERSPPECSDRLLNGDHHPSS